MAHKAAHQGFLEQRNNPNTKTIFHFEQPDTSHYISMFGRKTGELSRAKDRKLTWKGQSKFSKSSTVANILRKVKTKCFSIFACIDLPAKLGCKIAHLSEAAYRSIFSACSFWWGSTTTIPDQKFWGTLQLWLALLKPAAYKEGPTVKGEARGAKVMETFPNMCWQNQFYNFKQHCSTKPSPSSPSAAQPPCPWRLRR